MEEAYSTPKSCSTMLHKLFILILIGAIAYICVAMFVMKLPPFQCKAFSETYTHGASNSKCRILDIPEKDFAITTDTNLGEVVYCCENDCTSYGGHIPSKVTDKKPEYSCVTMSLPDYSDYANIPQGGTYTKVDVCTGDCTQIPAASREVAARWNTGFMLNEFSKVQDQMMEIYQRMSTLGDSYGFSDIKDSS